MSGVGGGFCGQRKRVIKGSRITAYFRFLRASRSRLARKPAAPMLNRLAIQFELHGPFLPQPARPRHFMFRPPRPLCPPTNPPLPQRLRRDKSAAARTPSPKRTTQGRQGSEEIGGQEIGRGGVSEERCQPNNQRQNAVPMFREHAATPVRTLKLIC